MVWSDSLCWCWLVPAAIIAQQYPHVVETEPLSPAEQQKKFHLPAGFEIELVAAEPQIAKPININFDARGRLLVTQSVEYPIAATGEDGRDAVKVLADNDGDGRYETTAASVEGLNIPIGVTSLGNAIVVFSIPNIYRAADATGDGHFEQRRKLLGPFGQEDTHGLNNGFTRWLDGWVYACHGFRNTSSVAGRDGHRVEMNSGNTYRFRADGSRIEQFTWGQVNPFGLAFDPLGNIYTADCHSKPMYQLLRGAYYPSFGKPHDGLGFGPTLIEHAHGSTGIGGIAYYAAEHFPQKYRDVIFVANPITHRINCDRLERHGSTYRGIELPDFLVCDDPWFRPVDLQLGPDGAIYVADFYNRIIGHYEVPLTHPGRDRRRGRIWRIVYKGADDKPVKLAAPDLTKLSLEQLWQKLRDSNLTVRVLATHGIVDRFGEKAREPVRSWIESETSPTARAHGIYLCARLDVLDDRLIQQLAEDESPLVRVHLMKVLADRNNWSKHSFDTLKLVRERLRDEDAFVRRGAADALALHPHIDNVEPLLKLWKQTPAADTHLIHVTRMALRDQLRVVSPWDDLKGDFARQPEAMGMLLDVGLGVRDAPSAEFVLWGLSRVEVPLSRRRELLGYAARFLPDGHLDDLVAEVLRARPNQPADQAALLVTLERGFQQRGGKLPARLRVWAVELAGELLSATAVERRSLGVQLARELRLVETHEALRRLVLSRELSADLRADALEACAAAAPAESVDLLMQILSGVRQPTALRNRAARALGAVGGNPGKQMLIEQLKTAYYNLAVEIAAALAHDRAGAESLLSIVSDGKVTPRVLQPRNVRIAVRNSGLPNWESRIAKLTAGVPPLDAQINQLIAQRRGEFCRAQVDLAAGATLFKKNCAACHRIGQTGEKIGPELDGIGNRGLDRLLEDLLDPSRAVDPAFHTTQIETKDGQVLSGLALAEEGQLLVLVDKDGKQRRIPLADIERRQKSPLSPMPANVADLLKGNDFHHLVAYLLSQREETGGR